MTEAIHFDDYNYEELVTIFKGYCEREQFVLAPDADNALRRYFSCVDKTSFGNGRGARNLYEKVKTAQAHRLVNSVRNKEALLTITAQDIEIAGQNR